MHNLNCSVYYLIDDYILDPGRHPGGISNKSMTLLWGATGEQEWTPALTTGKLYYYSRPTIILWSKNNLV